MREFYRNWFLASRPWSFVMTAISVGVGGSIAALEGPLNWYLCIATLLGAICLHAATNLINDYYDVKSGVDTSDVSTAKYRPHPLLEGKLRLENVGRAGYGLFFLGGGIGVWLALLRGWPILLIGVIGVAAGVAYTAPPVKYKHIALGELSVFLMWGPLMFEGAYFVQRQAFSWDAFYISIPFGVLVALVILANNLRDIEKDERQGVRTVAVLLGAKKGVCFYLGLMALAYISILVMVFLEILPIWSLMIFVSLPLAVKLIRTMAKDIPDDADARTAQLNTVFGALLLASLIAKVLL